MHGPAHASDNYSDTAVVPGNVQRLIRRWSVAGNFLASPVVGDGYVFIGSDSGEFYEINKFTGAVVAHDSLGFQPGIACPARGIVATAAVGTDPANGQLAVYEAAPDGYLYALAIPTLKLLWRSVIAIPSKTENNYFDWSSPTVANGKIYVGISSNCDDPLIRGGVAAFDQATGRRIATFYTMPPGVVGGSVWTTVAVDSAGYVYASTGNPSGTNPYYGVSIVKLTPMLRPVGHFTVPLSQRTTDNDFGGSPTIFGPYVGACNHNGIYYAVYRSTMRLAWWRVIGAKVGGPVQSQCAAGAAFDGKYLYIAGPKTTINGRVYQGSIRRLTTSGKFLWQRGLPNGVIGAPSLDGGGVLAVGTYDLTKTPNATYLLDVATGKILRVMASGSLDFAQTVFSGSWVLTANSSGISGWTF